MMSVLKVVLGGVASYGYSQMLKLAIGETVLSKNVQGYFVNQNTIHESLCSKLSLANKCIFVPILEELQYSGHLLARSHPLFLIPYYMSYFPAIVLHNHTPSAVQLVINVFLLDHLENKPTDFLLTISNTIFFCLAHSHNYSKNELLRVFFYYLPNSLISHTMGYYFFKKDYFCRFGLSLVHHVFNNLMCSF